MQNVWNQVWMQQLTIHLNNRIKSQEEEVVKHNGTYLDGVGSLFLAGRRHGMASVGVDINCSEL